MNDRNHEEPILLVQDLNIEFHDHIIPETVVYDFDITIYPGEIVGLVGESGSGKTMTALAIAGLLNRKNMKKRGKHDISEKLFTLSTLKQVFFVNYFCEKKNGCFVRLL